MHLGTMLVSYSVLGDISMTRKWIQRRARFWGHLWRYAVRERRRDAMSLARVASSSLFDQRYYLTSNPDVADAGVDPVIHYIDFGAQELRNPSTFFNTREYLLRNPVVTALTLNPLLHYILNSEQENPADLSRTVEREIQPPEPARAPANKPELAHRTVVALRKKAKVASIIADLDQLPDKELVQALQRIFVAIVAQRAKAYFRRKDWSSISRLGKIICNRQAEYHRLLLNVGRAQLYLAQAEEALNVLVFTAAQFPDSAEAQVYAGVAAMRAEKPAAAIDRFRAALELDPNNLTAKRELATVLRRVAKGLSDREKKAAMEREAIALLQAVYVVQRTPAAALAVGRPLYAAKRYEECLAALDGAVDVRVEHVEHLTLKSKALVALNRVGDALALSKQILELAPQNQTALFHVKTLRFLSTAERGKTGTVGDLACIEGELFVRSFGTGDFERIGGQELGEALRRLQFDWIRLAPNGEQPLLANCSGGTTAQMLDPKLGYISGIEGDFWRADVLSGLVRSGLVRSIGELDRFSAAYSAENRNSMVNAKAVVMSRNGAFKFGGGEHFIESMAEHYRALGYSPIIAGTRPELIGKHGEANGFPYRFLNEDADSLRHFFLANDVRLVHAISGMGFRVAEALSYSNIPFIYGVHYWREVLGHDDHDTVFFDSAGNPQPRREFEYILSQASVVYANSVYTRDVIEKAFGVRCPVVYSVPKAAVV
jgi:tetratricopeptide (TPR) repeat protein